MTTLYPFCCKDLILQRKFMFFLVSLEKEMAESLKLIPWLIRKLVTNMPVIIGKKACQNLYHLADTMITTTNGSTKKKSEATNDVNLSNHMPNRFISYAILTCNI